MWRGRLPGWREGRGAGAALAFSRRRPTGVETRGGGAEEDGTADPGVTDGGSWRDTRPGGGPAGRADDMAELVSAAVVIPAKDMAAVVSATAVGSRGGVHGRLR